MPSYYPKRRDSWRFFNQASTEASSWGRRSRSETGAYHVPSEERASRRCCPPPRRPTNPKKEKKKNKHASISEWHWHHREGRELLSSGPIQARPGRGGRSKTREERCYAYARKIRLLARVRVTTKGKGKWEVVEPITRRREAHETNAAAAAVQGCVWWLRSNATRRKRGAGWVNGELCN